MASRKEASFDGVVDLGPVGPLHQDHLFGEVISVGTGPDDSDIREALLLGLHDVAVQALVDDLRNRGLADEEIFAVLRRRIGLLTSAEATLHYRHFESTGALQTRRIAVPALATEVALLRDTVIPRLEAELRAARGENV